MNTLYPAHWLSLAGERDTEQIERYGKPCPCFRREFSLLDKPLKSAELWATAIGVFKAYVNRRRLYVAGIYRLPRPYSVA